MPSPTVQNFNIAPQPGPNSQPGGSEGAVFANGLPQTFAARKSLYLKKKFTLPAVLLLLLLFLYYHYSIIYLYFIVLPYSFLLQYYEYYYY